MRKHSARRFTAILMGGALASKLLGFCREIMMAHVLGASLIADGFRGANTAVMIPLAFLQNESLPAVMIPMHRDALREGNAPRSFGALTVALTLIGIVLALLVEALGEVWISAVVGGFTAAGRTLTLQFVHIMALGMPASVMLNVLASGEIALGRTRLTNIRAGILNISALAGIAVLISTGTVDALAWSFTGAFNGLAAWGLWTLYREGAISFDGLTTADIFRTTKEFLLRLRPLFALPLAEQGNVWVERVLVSRITTGAVASLDYARTLTESALLLISQPVGLAVLSNHPPKDMGAQVEAIARPVLALSLPASAFVVMFAPEIVRLIFFRGAFGEEAVLLTSQSLRGIAFGLWAATLAWILIRILNGAGRNALAAMIIVSAYAVNIAVNLALSGFMLTGPSGLLIVGLGETARSLVLLGGVIFALEGGRKLLLLILIALIPAGLMAFLGWQVHLYLDGMYERLIAGGAAYVGCVALASALLIPTVWEAGLNRLGRKFRIGAKLP